MATIEKRELSGGVASYRARVRIKGHPQQIATFERLTDARRWVQQTEAAIREGRYFKTSQARKFTFSDALERYRTEILIYEKASNINLANYLAYWEKELGAYAMADITPALIVSARNKLLGSKGK
ncbi:MAG: site-specific integrase, partial [Alphaproteobacteria bacterium]